jgi:hypothetical protein
MEDEVTTLTRLAAIGGLLGGGAPIAFAFLLSQPGLVKVLISLTAVGVFLVPFLLLRADRNLPAEFGPKLRSLCWVACMGALVLSALLVTANYYWSDIPSTIESSANQWNNSRVGEFDVAEPKMTTVPSVIRDPQAAFDEWVMDEADKDHAVRIVGVIRTGDKSGRQELLVRIFPASIYLKLNAGPVPLLENFLTGWLVLVLGFCIALLIALPWADDNGINLYRASATNVPGASNGAQE